MQLRLIALHVMMWYFEDLLLQASIAAHEAVHTTGCVNELALTSIERVRGA